MTDHIHIVVVDDHPVVRAGIVGLIETETDFTVVGEADSGEEAVTLVERLSTEDQRKVDVVLMDLRMPGMGGVEATRVITQAKQARVLVFTTYEDDDQILAAIESGASGYLLKAAPAAELAAGIRAVAQGQTVLAPSVAAQLVHHANRRHSAADQPTPQLTPREHEILELVAQGLSNPGIAERLFIGESTVKTHLIHVFEKLEVSDRTRAVTRAMELGML